MDGWMESTQQNFTKLDGKVVLGPRKKPLDCSGIPDHVTLGLGLG